MEMSIRYIFFIDLKSVQYKLSSDYSLNICFSRRFPAVFSVQTLTKFSIFERSVTCSFFQELYSHIDKNSGEKVRGYVSRQSSKQGNILKGCSINYQTGIDGNFFQGHHPPEIQ